MTASENSPDGRAGITSSLVQTLINTQFPHWSHLPIKPVSKDGWDNRTYRLGDHLTVRLPTAGGYEAAIAKENEWLPRLAPSLPLAIPSIQACGKPGSGYPFSWSIRDWIPGDTLEAGPVEDWDAAALSLGQFIKALQRCDASHGPATGAHCWFRGAPLTHYDEETRRAITEMSELDGAAATRVWQAAVAQEWKQSPVWFHGDLATGNLLLLKGNLSAVIDFGACGVGDPACDLVPAWTIFSGSSRRVFQETVKQDAAMWARARGWALWKGLITMNDDSKSSVERRAAAVVVEEVIREHGESDVAFS